MNQISINREEKKKLLSQLVNYPSSKLRGNFAIIKEFEKITEYDFLLELLTSNVLIMGSEFGFAVLNALVKRVIQHDSYEPLELYYILFSELTKAHYTKHVPDRRLALFKQQGQLFDDQVLELILIDSISLFRPHAYQSMTSNPIKRVYLDS